MYIGLRLIAGLLAALLALTACGGDAPTPTAEAVAVVRVLVTVDVPPTLSAAERAATLAALPPTPTVAPPTPTPTETPYIGVFIGEARAPESNLPPMNVEPTPQPTEAGVCTIPTDPAFGEVWKRDASLVRRLGCAIQERFGFAGGVQVFERGVMYRRQSTNEVWAINPGRVTAGQYWYTNQVPLLSTQGIFAPPGFRVPVDVFGAVWAATTDLRDALGYAITPDQVADMNIQRFDGGTLFLDVTVGQVFVLLVDGDAYGPF